MIDWQSRANATLVHIMCSNLMNMHVPTFYILLKRLRQKQQALREEEQKHSDSGSDSLDEFAIKNNRPRFIDLHVCFRLM